VLGSRICLRHDASILFLTPGHRPPFPLYFWVMFLRELFAGTTLFGTGRRNYVRVKQRSAPPDKGGNLTLRCCRSISAGERAASAET